MPADGYLNFDTKIDTDGFSSGVKDVERHVKDFGGAIDKLGAKLRTAFNIAAITAFTKATIESAADVKAAASQFEQTFGELGDAASAAIKRVAGPADILETRLSGVATTIYAFAKTSGMESSQALGLMEDALEVAADSAAYYDRSLEDVAATLQSFLKGNYANDAALGLSATETTRNAKAMALYGKKFQDLSEAQKQFTLLEMVKDANKLSGAMGQAAREAEGWENVTGNLAEAWRQFMAAIGQPALKLAIPIVRQMTDALMQMTEWANAAYAAMSQVFGWGDKQAEAIQGAADAEKELAEAVEDTEKAQEGALAGFDEIEVLASGAAEATKETADSAADTALTDAEALPTATQEVDTSMVDEMVEKLQALKDFIDRQLKPAFESLKPVIRSALASLGDYVQTTVIPSAQRMLESYRDAFLAIVNYINTVVKPALQEISEKYDFSFDLFLPENIDELFAPIQAWFEEDLPEMIRMMADTSVKLLDPIARWFTTDLPAFVQSGITLAATVVGGLLDSFTTVFSDIWTLVIDPFLLSFAEKLLPTFTQLGTQILDTLTVAFTEVKSVFDTLWAEGVEPVLKFIGDAWTNLCELFKSKWDEFGAPVFEKLRTAFEKTGDVFQTVWGNVLKPVWDSFMATIDTLWHEHIMPFLDSFLSFVGKLVEGVLSIYNEFLAPFVELLINWLAPAVTSLLSTIISAVGEVVGNIIDFAKNIIDALSGLIDFLVGVFTGDWEKVWDGIKTFFKSIWDGIQTIFKTAVNVIIGFVNLLISAVESALNLVIGALNSIQISIPSWVPGIGGRSFGINIPLLSFKQIPYLASGAVIPPNREFLAVLGDQKEGVNIETPLETMLEAFRAALAENGGRGQQTVILMLDKRELGRAVIEAGSAEERRIGIKVVST